MENIYNSFLTGGTIISTPYILRNSPFKLTGGTNSNAETVIGTVSGTSNIYSSMWPVGLNKDISSYSIIEGGRGPISSTTDSDFFSTLPKTSNSDISSYSSIIIGGTACTISSTTDTDFFSILPKTSNSDTSTGDFSTYEAILKHRHIFYEQNDFNKDEKKLKKIKVRYNKNRTSSKDTWTLQIDSIVYNVAEIIFKEKTYTTLDMENGELKANISCESYNVTFEEIPEKGWCVWVGE